MTKRAQRTGYRLAYAVPMTPWPVVFWFQTLPDWSGGAHGANALAGVSKAIPLALLLTTVLGFVLNVIFRRSWSDVATWAVLATIHFFVIFGYVTNSTTWYS